MSKYYILGQEIIKMTELNTWATPRLLRFYKSIRKLVVGRTRGSFYENTREWMEFPILEAYIEKVRVLLCTREHVRQPPKLGKRQKVAGKRLLEARKKYGFK